LHKIGATRADTDALDSRNLATMLVVLRSNSRRARRKAAGIIVLCHPYTQLMFAKEANGSGVSAFLWCGRWILQLAQFLARACCEPFNNNTL
jgi:hypothetical protein